MRRPHAEERALAKRGNKSKLECARVSKQAAAFVLRDARCAMPALWKVSCLRAPQDEAEQGPVLILAIQSEPDPISVLIRICGADGSRIRGWPTRIRAPSRTSSQRE